MTAAILGLGGVGGLLAGLMERSGGSPYCIATPESQRTISTEGIRVKSEFYGHFRVRVRVECLLSEQVDLMFVATKAGDLTGAIGRVSADLLTGTIVVPLLNGIEHVDQLRRSWPQATVIPATIGGLEAYSESRGVVLHRSNRRPVVTFPEEPVGYIDRAARELSSAGFEVRRDGSETQVMWEKLARLAPMALVTSLTGWDLGAVRTNHGSKELLVGCVREAVEVARSEGAVLDADEVIGQIWALPAMLRTSAQRDVAAGRPSELDALGGAIQRRATAKGIMCPSIERVLREMAVA